MAYIVNGNTPEYCNKCPFSSCKFSFPLSAGTHGYTCNLEVPVEGSNKTTMITDYNADIEKPDWCPLQTVSDKEETNAYDVCEWHCDVYGRWHTKCHTLADNDPLEYTYCPYCGKKIKVME